MHFGRYPGQIKSQFTLIEQKQIAKPKKALSCRDLVVDLINDDRGIGKELDSLAVEVILINLHKPDQSDTGSVFALIAIALVLGAEDHSVVGNRKRDESLVDGELFMMKIRSVEVTAYHRSSHDYPFCKRRAVIQIRPSNVRVKMTLPEVVLYQGIGLPEDLGGGIGENSVVTEAAK